MLEFCGADRHARTQGHLFVYLSRVYCRTYNYLYFTVELKIVSTWRTLPEGSLLFDLLSLRTPGNTVSTVSHSLLKGRADFPFTC